LKEEMANHNLRAQMMSAVVSGRAHIAHNVILDGRLALFHETERWLAVADLHFGYELSQRAAGWLIPLWGMQSIEQRLMQLIKEYQPQRLIVAGDLVHDKASIEPAIALVDRLRRHCEVVTLSGNHDRHVRQAIGFARSWETPQFIFHHGDCALPKPDRIQIIGHHHPAFTIRDGAGLRLKLPAFVQQEQCWILPAFSPWAGGVAWPDDGQSQVWICSPRRVLRVQENSVSA
jgi:DNA ligase-associated metallophosphoesterase